MSVVEIASEDIERNVIGAIFKDSSAASYILSSCIEEDFTTSVRTKIFIIAKHFYDKNGYVNRESIDTLIKSKTSDYEQYTIEIDKSYLFQSNEHFENKVELLKTFSFRRKIYNKSLELAGKASDLQINLDDVIKDASSFNSGIYTGYKDTAQNPEDILENEKELELISYGDEVLDNGLYKIGGRALGTTELIFARPGHGKTYMLFYKEGKLVNNGYKGIHFHLEDSSYNAAVRYMNMVDKNSPNFNNLKISTKDRYLHEIIRTIRYYKYKYDIEFFSVDHLGRVKVAGYNSKFKLEAQIEASNELTDLCVELNMFGMLCVQPNKSRERRGYQNILREEDLKGASEVFEDAFLITTLIRPNLYPELVIDDGNNVKDPSGNATHYDSIFVSQIKNRMSRIENVYMQMIQEGNRFYQKREYYEKHNPPQSAGF